MNNRSLFSAFFVAIFSIFATSVAAQQISKSEKCGTVSNILTIRVVPCDPPTAAEFLEQIFQPDKIFQENYFDWTPAKHPAREVRLVKFDPKNA